MMPPVSLSSPNAHSTRKQMMPDQRSSSTSSSGKSNSKSPDAQDKGPEKAFRPQVMRLPPPLHVSKDELVWQWEDREVDSFDLLWCGSAPVNDDELRAVQLLQKAVHQSLPLSELSAVQQ